MTYFVIQIFWYKFGFLATKTLPKCTCRKLQHKPAFHVHNTVPNIEKILQKRTLSSDTDALAIICNNSATVHICNDKSMFVGTIHSTDKHYVTIIDGSRNTSSDMGPVRWCWKDNAGKQHNTDAHGMLLLS